MDPNSPRYQGINTQQSSANKCAKIFQDYMLMESVTNQEASERRTRGLNIAKEGNIQGLPEIRLAVLATFNVDLMAPYLREAISRTGSYGEVFIGEYGQTAQQVLDPNSAFYSEAPEHVVLIPAVEDMLAPLFSRPSEFSTQEAQAMVDDRVAEISGYISTILEKLPTTTCYVVAFGSETAPVEHLLSPVSSGRGQMAVERYIQAIRTMGSLSSRAVIVDWDWHSQRFHAIPYSDDRLWYLGRMRLNPIGLAGLADLVLTHVSAQRGQARKVAVVDLDDTLWGGIVGEDGLKGLKLGQDGLGLAFQDFQRELLKLHDAGILLAICSKNNADDVWEVFDHYPGMLLMREHFSAHRINWQDKATNLEELSEELSLGIDSFVFFDDNPLERDWVRTALPEVLVPDLPEDPCYRARFLNDSPFFKRIDLTDADSRRTKSYQEQSQRRTLQEQMSSLDEFLTSLEQEVTIELMTEGSISRAAQMCQRTNQFNLTSKRYSVAELESMLTDPLVEIYILSVSDRFGDSGITGLGILRYGPKDAVIDTLLLSCRVLGRKVEDVFLAFMAERVRNRGGRHMAGEYIPSKKNGQVANFYTDRGFETVREGHFNLDLAQGGPDDSARAMLKLIANA